MRKHDDVFGPIVMASAPGADDVFGPLIAVKHGPGPKSTFNQDIADKICEAICDGMTFRKIEKLEGVPRKSTIFRWAGDNPAFNLQLHLALRWRTYVRADEIIEISDDATKDWIEVEDPATPGLMIKEPNKELLARIKMKIDTRFRLMEKENPKRFGIAPTLLVDLAEVSQQGGNAKQVEGGAFRLIDLHPMRDQVEAWRKAATES